jgi:hypothetical protein
MSEKVGEDDIPDSEMSKFIRSPEETLIYTQCMAGAWPDAESSSTRERRKQTTPTKKRATASDENKKTKKRKKNEEQTQALPPTGVEVVATGNQPWDDEAEDSVAF